MALSKKDRETAWSWVFFGSVILLFLAVWVFFHVLLSIFMALALAYAFGPWVDRMERRGIGRGWCVAGLMLVLALVAGFLMAIVLPVLFDQARSFAATFPDDLSTVTLRVADWANRFGFDFPVGQKLIESLRESVNGLSFSSVFPGVDLARKVFLGLGSAVSVLFRLAAVPVFFFFLLRDLPKIKRFAFELIPLRHQALALEELHKIDKVLSSYLRGQMTMSVILGTVFALALTVLDVRFGLFIGFLTGFLNIVPYIGQATGLLLAMMMVTLDFKDWPGFWAVPLTFACINFVESNFVSPKVVGGSVGLSTVQTLLAVMLAAHLGGVVGVALALPVAGTIKVLLIDLVAAYHASDYYLKLPRGRKQP
jgi:predicted PurR-regulated permease PerM